METTCWKLYSFKTEIQIRLLIFIHSFKVKNTEKIFKIKILIAVVFFRQLLSVCMILLSESKKTNKLSVQTLRNFVSTWYVELRVKPPFGLIVRSVHSRVALTTKNKTWTKVSNSYTISNRAIGLATIQNCLASCSIDSSTVQCFDLFCYFNCSRIFPCSNI